MQKPTNITKHELIGLEVEVIQSKNADNIGIKGKIIDETKNMFIITVDGKEKKVAKENSQFTFKIPNGKELVVEGSLLVGKPETRITKRIPKKRV
jgi:ribonuclease P protein subunit POP4